MAKPIRIMPCLDMRNGRVVKGVHFVNIQDAGDPVACAKAYCDAGADELALLDITATVEKRKTMCEVVRAVAAVTTIPFTVGGGITDVAGAAAVLESGADRISTSSAAFRNPSVIEEMVKAFGPDRVTVAIDVDRNEKMPSGYEVYIKRAERTGKLNGWEAGVRKEEGDAVGWVKIYRKDWEHPFIHEVYFKEVAQYRKDGALTDFWARSPRFQLKKVAISQGFRLCFPDELGGMPYTSDELPDAMAGREEINVTPASAKQPEPQTDDTIPEAPENFIDDIPGSQEPAPKKPAVSANPDDRQAFLQELRPLMATKRDMIYAFANNNADCLDDEAIQYVHDLDIIAEKHFRKTGQHPIDFMESVQKRLAKAVGESRAQKAREAVPVF